MPPPLRPDTRMNDRQRDLFLWQWSQRRLPGRQRVALRGTLIGALGGIAFSVIMLANMGAPAANGYTGLAYIIPVLERGWLMLCLSVPTFAVIGFAGASRVYSANERMYQSILQTGAQVPQHKPALHRSDRWPAIMVGVVAAIIAGFIGYLFWASSTGNL